MKIVMLYAQILVPFPFTSRFVVRACVCVAVFIVSVVVVHFAVVILLLFSIHKLSFAVVGAVHGEHSHLSSHSTVKCISMMYECT